MASSLPSLTDNLAKGLHKDKCEKYKSGLEYATVKYSTLTFKCVDCNKNHEKELDKGPTKRFENTYRFCGGGINKLSLILRQDVYPNEYMDS